MRFAFILSLAMVATWLTLSGYFIPLILIFGAISIGIVVWMCRRMGILDGETVPYLTVPLTLQYFIWLFSEIVKANVQVVKAVLSPDLEVSPTLVKIPLNTDADIAETMFANSITLTPGTVSVDMQPDHILVHALLEDMSAPEGFEEMERRSAWAVGHKVEGPY
jgi:multicomponent Na+:H+ antiporter subunit E